MSQSQCVHCVSNWAISAMVSRGDHMIHFQVCGKNGEGQTAFSTGGEKQQKIRYTTANAGALPPAS